MPRCSSSLALATALLLAGCMPDPRLPRVDPGAAPFDAVGFFTGRTHGLAVLKVLLHRRVPVLVESEGHVGDDGTLLLDQEVREGAKPPRHRRWRIREVAPGRYAGTLVPDAVGTVRGTAAPGRLMLGYAMKDGVAVTQELALAADGRSATNILTARAHGLRVAVLEEVIRKDD